ncbi:MAG: KH domain-containing protein [Anaerolineales bacterium]|nr:KH domain-containing protein [Anaerolineales bacterium]
MKDLIEFIAKSLVDDPTQVEVKEELERGRIRLILTVADEDMGRVIGKGGRVANAMRSLLRVKAAQRGTKASLDIR